LRGMCDLDLALEVRDQINVNNWPDNK
jgi:hypothetical protein